MEQNKKCILQCANSEDRTDVVDLSINNAKNEFNFIGKSSNSKFLNVLK